MIPKSCRSDDSTLGRPDHLGDVDEVRHSVVALLDPLAHLEWALTLLLFGSACDPSSDGVGAIVASLARVVASACS